MLVMSGVPEHEPEESTVTDPAPEPAPAEQPWLSRFAERFRLPIGVVVALLGAALAVVFAIRPLDADADTGGLLSQGAGVALWLCVVGVGVTWALNTSRKVTNAFVLAAVGCYLVFWLAGR